jgi:hypothetical protein
MARFIILICTGLFCVSFIGCSTLFPLKKDYSMTQDWNSEHIIEESTQPPTDSAQALVSTAKTVAFFPPDACRTTKAAGPGASEVSNVMRLNCGVLMSELEAEATRAGFHVVSWQTLRGTERPVDYAAQNNVDILFEINELSFDVPTQDIYTVADTSFFENGSSISVYNADAVAETCRQRYAASAFPPAVVVTLDMKMVSVNDGRIGWYYRKTEAEEQDGSLKLKRTFPTYGTPNSTLGWLGDISWGLGLSSFVVGGVMVGLGLALQYPALYGGALLMAFTPIPLVAWAGFATVAHLLASYPEPELVICKGIALEDYQVAAAPPPAIRTAHSVHSEKISSINKADVEERRKQLLKGVVANFMTQLNHMRTTEPSVGAPPLSPSNQPKPPQPADASTATEPQIGDTVSGHKLVGFAGEKTLEDGRRITGKCGYIRNVLVESVSAPGNGIIRAQLNVPCQQTVSGLEPGPATLKLNK